MDREMRLRLLDDVRETARKINNGLDCLPNFPKDLRLDPEVWAKLAAHILDEEQKPKAPQEVRQDESGTFCYVVHQSDGTCRLFRDKELRDEIGGAGAPMPESPFLAKEVAGKDEQPQPASEWSTARDAMMHKQALEAGRELLELVRALEQRLLDRRLMEEEGLDEKVELDEGVELLVDLPNWYYEEEEPPRKPSLSWTALGIRAIELTALLTSAGCLVAFGAAKGTSYLAYAAAFAGVLVLSLKRRHRI